MDFGRILSWSPFNLLFPRGKSNVQSRVHYVHLFLATSNLHLKHIFFQIYFLFFTFFWYGNGVGPDYHCTKIDYFPSDEYTPDPNDSTMAIPCKYIFIIFLLSFGQTN